MLNANDLLNKMKLHFPRWMDIRKRVTKSDGGKLLMAVAEETANLQDAINEYKKDFFIDGYDGREDTIVAFVYKLHVGDLDADQLIITKPALEIIEDIKEFYSKTGFAYYEDGNLYFRVEDIVKTPATINYSIDGFPTSGIAEKIHVWNIFDEFATFVSLQRHEGETNEQLEQRVLNVFRRRTNSTEPGLQNAILNELMFIDPELTIEEINISKPTPENLVKYYKEFGSVIEKLAHVNRDVYRTKRWDLDSWNYSLKSVEYLPHAWDYALDAFQNGVGFEDDLKVDLTSPTDVTDSRITFYAESAAKVQEYVKNNDTKTDIELKLSQYNNVLKPITAKYKITASEAVDITAAPIYINSRDTISGEETRYIDEMATADTKDIQINDRAVLPNEKRYKLIFTPKAAYGTMEIQKCSVLNTTDGVTTESNLMAAKPGFVLDSDGHIVSSNIKLYADEKRDFMVSQNITNVQDGIALDDLMIAGTASLDITGMAHQYIKVKYACELSATPDQYITRVGFELNQGVISCNTDPIQKYVEIALEGNQISVDMLEGNYIVETYADGNMTSTKPDSGAKTFKTPLEKSPKNLVMKIIPIGSSKVSLTNVRYSKFIVAYGLEQGRFININGDEVLPDYPQNKLLIYMQAFTGYSPVINYIYVGSSLANASYETSIIEGPVGTSRKLEIVTDCNIALVEVDGSGNVVATTNNYEPHKEYVALTDQAYVKLDTSAYSYIESMKATAGRFESIGTGENLAYYMRFRKAEIGFKLTVNGERLVEEKQRSLIDILGVNPEAGDILYANALKKALVVVNGDTQTLKYITPTMISSIPSESYTVTGLPDDIGCAFILSDSDDSSVISDTRNGAFSSLYLFPKNTQTYIAFNDTKLVCQEIAGIEISDVFNPFLPSGLMMYVIESLDPTGTTSAKFDKAGADFITLPDWSIGRKTLRVAADINMTDTFNYETSAMVIDKEFSLGDVIPLDTSYTLETGEIIELAKYMIQPPSGMAVQYRTKQPLQTIVDAPEFYCSETLTREEDGFNKLKYSNIDEIIYLGATPWDPDTPDNNTPIDNAEYVPMKPQGILVWNGSTLPVGQPFYIVYTIKIPDYISVDLSVLYRLIEYSIEAYKEVGSLDLTGMANGNTYNLKTNQAYLQSSRMTIFCSEPGFEAKVESGVVTFKKTSQDNVVAVKTGYYYIDGQEYYMFADESSDKIDQFSNTQFFNVDRTDGQMTLNKRTKNFVKNSYMDLGRVADIYSMDFIKNESVYGISRLNAITACSNFNRWNTFCCNMYLAQGLNGVGIRLEPTITNGYAYIDITDFVLQHSYLSFYAQGQVTAFIGKERKFNGMSLAKSVLVDPIITIERSVVEVDMMECTFTVDPDYRYYLIFKGAGIVDDIILQADDGVSVKKGIHQKNIDLIDLGLEEKIMDDYTSRLYFDNRTGKGKGAEVNDADTIVNSSMIDWGITKIKEFDEPQSWIRCTTTKVSLVNGVAQTKDNIPGKIETEPVYIGDKRMIKSIIFEINDVLLENMKGFVVRIATCDTMTGDYRVVSTHKDNTGSIRGEFLSQYVKLIIEMPGGKIINNITIYAEYKSTAEAAPREVSMSNGLFTSGILDTHYSANYQIKGIATDSISNINDVVIQVRGARENYSGDIWTPWKTVTLDGNLEVADTILFEKCRFFQARVTLKSRNAYIKLDSIDLKVV